MLSSLHMALSHRLLPSLPGGCDVKRAALWGCFPSCATSLCVAAVESHWTLGSEQQHLLCVQAVRAGCCRGQHGAEANRQAVQRHQSTRAAGLQVRLLGQLWD